MLKKKLGPEAIERNWSVRHNCLIDYFKIPPTLIIPEGVESIGYHALCYSNLKKVVIPGSVKYIGPCAFWKCKKLEEVIISESVKRIGYEAFYYCSNATIILKKRREDFEKIGLNAFAGCNDVKEEIRS